MSFDSIYELHVAPPRSRHKTVFLTEHMEELAVPMLIPGITLKPPRPTYYGIKQMRLKRFDGARWVPLAASSAKK